MKLNKKIIAIATSIAATVATIFTSMPLAQAADDSCTYDFIMIDALDGQDQPLANVSFELVDSNDDVVATWTTDASGSKTIRNIKSGVYTLTEISTPANFKTPDDVTIELASNGKTQPYFEVKHISATTYDLTFKKIDAATGKSVPGAHFTLKDSNGNTVDSWISDEPVHTVSHVEYGTYVLKETKAPDGYLAMQDMTIVLEKNGKSQTVFEIENEPTSITVKKIASDTEGPLAGAVFNIYGLDIDYTTGAFATTDDADGVTVRALPFGKYELRETQAPTDYAIAEPIEFTIDAENPHLTFTVVDEKIEIVSRVPVLFSKIDKEKKTELKDAVLEIYRVENNDKTLVTSWTTTGETKLAKLEAGNYELVEKEAPAGYVKANSIAFKVVNRTTPVVTETPVNPERPDELSVVAIAADKYTMEDDFIKVDILKIDEKQNPVVGAKLQVKDSEGNIIKEFVTDGKAYRLDRLPAGKYTLVEKETPQGYIASEPVPFTVEAIADVQTVRMVDKKADEKVEVLISKQDITNSKELPGAVLIVKDKDGKEIERWTSGESAHKIQLKPGKYSLTEISAPSGYVKAETVNFTVAKNGSVATSVTMKDDVTKVEIYKLDKANEANLKGAKFELYDKDNKLVESWTSDGSAKKFEKLAHGKYTLKEVQAPEGYKKANDITFEVTDKAGVIKVKMYNEKETKAKVTPTPTVKPTPTPAQKATTAPAQNVDRVQTGDENPIGLFICFAVALMITGFAIIKVKSKKEE